MEDNKEPETLVEKVDALYADKKKLEDNKNKKGEGGIQSIIAFLGVGGIIGYLFWLFLGITWGAIIGCIAGGIAFFFVKRHYSSYWMVPFNIRFMTRKAKRSGYIVLAHLGQNKAIWFEKVKIDEGVAIGKDGNPHVITSEDIFIWKNRLPMVLVPEFSKYPIRANELYKDTLATKGAGTMGWQWLMNYIYKTQIKEKKQVGMGVIVIVILVLLGLGYYAFKSGAFS